MSAIVGLHYADDRRVNRADLNRMVSTLKHRGPDGSGLWSQGPVGLGHLMLWTTPESCQERLPLADAGGDLVITASARLDNRDDLARLFDINNHDLSEITDSQLILMAYERWSESCPNKLLGDFAFAVWDSRKQALFCARDHFGVKPFYYSSSMGMFAFATEIKALLVLAEVPHRLNEVRVGDFLVGFEDPASTFYRDILRLPPAHCVTVTSEGVRLRPYWQLDASRDLRMRSEEEYAEALRELFTQAVRCRLRSVFPVGSMLSGGLDSSSITCVARRLLPQDGTHRLHAFSGVFDQVAECDERHFQNAVLALGSVEPVSLQADKIGPFFDLDRVLWHQDEPISAGNLRIDWGLYQLAKDRGVRVILDGFDGDSTLSHGDGYLLELACAGRWLALANEARAYALKLKEPWVNVLWAWVWLYGLDPMIAGSRMLRRLRQSWRRNVQRVNRRSSPSLSGPTWKRLLRPEFVERISMMERLQSEPGGARTEREIHYRRLTSAGMPYTLETLDKAAAAFSVELRFPFWDKRLVEFCLAVPPWHKLNKGWNRMVMRRAMAGILPREVQWRASKTDMHPGFEYGLRTFESARLEQIILNDGRAIEDYLDMPLLKEVFYRFVASEATVDEVNTMWKAVSLGLWLRYSGLHA